MLSTEEGTTFSKGEEKELKYGFGIEDFSTLYSTGVKRCYKNTCSVMSMCHSNKYVGHRGNIFCPFVVYPILPSSQPWLSNNQYNSSHV